MVEIPVNGRESGVMLKVLLAKMQSTGTTGERSAAGRRGGVHMVELVPDGTDGSVQPVRCSLRIHTQYVHSTV